MKKQFLGLGKTKYTSSVCLLDENNIEMLLTERLDRKKSSGAWPEKPLKKILHKLNKENVLIAENRDVHKPETIEETYNKIFPFYEHLKLQKLDLFVRHFNPELEFVGHHLCHAHAALAMSPFEKSVIIVIDGAGSEIQNGEFEECSVFLQNGVNLELVLRQTVNFQPSRINAGQTFGNRIGATYEKVSEFIFNSPNSSGKVMGLAPFGSTSEYHDHYDFQENLPWEKSFKSKSKTEWEKLDHKLFENLAASVQEQIETEYAKVISAIKNKFPEYRNLILSGGCALNCTNNAKILYENLFDKIYVPPFPGDESIGFGLAHFLKFKINPESWKVSPFESQSAYFGPVDSVPEDNLILNEFNSPEYIVEKCSDIILQTTHLLKNFEIVAWFQGRSESGPRALGNRSILARPDKEGLKDTLNKTIKFRESFRPFGCSVIHSKSQLYFDVPEGFDNPYMSYAVKVRGDYKKTLKEVSHIDNTSRMQTVRPGQNQKFHDLIECFGNETGLYCLLNTSLNVMDEPILETVSDARRFMDKSPVKFMAIGNYLITRKS